MQLGTRWTAGDAIPGAVPAALHEQIRAVEAVLDEATVGSARPRWTLTFLEGRPIADLDTGVVVELAADGSVTVRHDDEDEFG